MTKDNKDIDYVRSIFFTTERSADEVPHDHELDPNKRISNGQTALHWFAYYGDATMIDLLCSIRADPNIADDDGFSPAHYAAWRGKARALETLVCNGADLTRPTYDGRSVADLARLGGHDALADMIERAIANGNGKMLGKSPRPPGP